MLETGEPKISVVHYSFHFSRRRRQQTRGARECRPVILKPYFFVLLRGLSPLRNHPISLLWVGICWTRRVRGEKKNKNTRQRRPSRQMRLRGGCDRLLSSFFSFRIVTRVDGESSKHSCSTPPLKTDRAVGSSLTAKTPLHSRRHLMFSV